MARYVVGVNGRARRGGAGPGHPVLAILRYDFGLTASRFGCGEGQCGACTVLLDGAGARSCVIPFASVGAKAITTIEALATGEKLHPAPPGFLDVEAFQCGYGTSGMVMAAVGVPKATPNPSAAD